MESAFNWRELRPAAANKPKPFGFCPTTTRAQQQKQKEILNIYLGHMNCLFVNDLVQVPTILVPCPAGLQPIDPILIPHLAR